MLTQYEPNSDEENRSIAEHCNRITDAIGKIDEVSEQFERLKALDKDQLNNLQLLRIKCTEMEQSIAFSK